MNKKGTKKSKVQAAVTSTTKAGLKVVKRRKVAKEPEAVTLTLFYSGDSTGYHIYRVCEPEQYTGSIYVSKGVEHVPAEITCRLLSPKDKGWRGHAEASFKKMKPGSKSYYRMGKLL